MFSPALGRVVRSSSSLSAPAVCSFGRPAALSAAAQLPFSRPSHQRRPSSSKASIPPDGSNEKGSSSAQQTPASADKAPVGKVPAKKVTGRTGRKRSSPPPALNVPHVPPTDYLQKPEVKISSFFSLHRPISLTDPIPPVSTNTSFDSIFKARASGSKKAMKDTMQALSSNIEGLYAVLHAHQNQVPEEMLNLEAEAHHVDGKSVEQLMARFVPFFPPPVPLPLGHAAETEIATQPADDASMIAASVKQRAWSTEVVVTESTDATGKRTYSATTAPMVEISVPTVEHSHETEEFEIRQPFLQRMKQRQITNTRRRDNPGRPDILAISVKRQRKLKMKKHKYKKLMKRTRLLRRKLDRT